MEPENTKKLPKIQKWLKVIICIFSVIFVYFRAPTRGSCSFFRNFSYFWGISGVFVICTRPAGSQYSTRFLKTEQPRQGRTVGGRRSGAEAKVERLAFGQRRREGRRVWERAARRHGHIFSLRSQHRIIARKGRGTRTEPPAS